MTETLDEFIPNDILLVRCPYCGRVVSEFESYMYCNDVYDAFEDCEDPSTGYIEEEFSAGCDSCEKRIDFIIELYPQRFEIRKTEPPPARGLFSLPAKGLFSTPGNSGGDLFALPSSGGLFAAPQKDLPTLPPKKGLFSLNRRKR